jgi:hypothetical protein
MEGGELSRGESGLLDFRGERLGQCRRGLANQNLYKMFFSFRE